MDNNRFWESVRKPDRETFCKYLFLFDYYGLQIWRNKIIDIWASMMTEFLKIHPNCNPNQPKWCP